MFLRISFEFEDFWYPNKLLNLEHSSLPFFLIYFMNLFFHYRQIELDLFIVSSILPTNLQIMRCIEITIKDHTTKNLI